MRPGGSPTERPGAEPDSAAILEELIDSLVYLSVGAGRHVDELRFSIMSAGQHLRDDSTWNIVLYTDDAAPFADLPVDVVPVDAATWSDWVGPHGYVWRAKINVIATALSTPGMTRCVYVDGDTYFVRSPDELFRRVGPGRSVLHTREGWPPPPEVDALAHVLERHQPTDTAGRPWSFGNDRASWNAGVVGLHEDEVDLCEEVLDLTDQLLAHGFGEYSHTSEQLAFAVCLTARTSVRGCQDVLVHYWRSDLREPFAPMLQETLADPSLTPQQRFDRLWVHRPRERTAKQAKTAIKRLAWRVGARI